MRNLFTAFCLGAGLLSSNSIFGKTKVLCLDLLSTVIEESTSENTTKYTIVPAAEKILSSLSNIEQLKIVGLVPPNTELMKFIKSSCLNQLILLRNDSIPLCEIAEMHLENSESKDEFFYIGKLTQNQKDQIIEEGIQYLATDNHKENKGLSKIEVISSLPVFVYCKSVRTPMEGKFSINSELCQTSEKWLPSGARIGTIEAMKMLSEITIPQSGIPYFLPVKESQILKKGEIVMYYLDSASPKL